jgi:hypothetical protein
MTTKKNTKPVFKLVVSDDTDDLTGVSVVSLVKDPAILRNFVKFSTEDRTPIKFTIQDKAKQIVSGPIMIADLPIYRNQRDAQGEIVDEWFVVADADTISKVVQKYFKTQRTTNVNLEHSGTLIPGVYMFESFIIDDSRGIKAPAGYEDLAQGSWFGSFKVENPEIWESIESGAFQGFSIEGLFDYAKMAMSSHKEKSELQLFLELQKVLAAF